MLHNAVTSHKTHKNQSIYVRQTQGFGYYILKVSFK